MEKERIYDEFYQYIVPRGWEDRVQDPEEYKKWHMETVKSKEAIEKFWEEWANKLFWLKKWEKVLDDSNPPFYRWFIGGETNLAYLATDWQISQGRKNKVALIWEGEPYDEIRRAPKEVKKFTYFDLYRESNRIAYALKEKLGYKKSEAITFYLPVIPELPMYMLAAQRIGVFHSIVFSGFTATALAERTVGSGSRVIVTADALYRRGRIIKLKEIVDEAVKICESWGYKIEHVIVVRRTDRTDVPWVEGRDIWHEDFIADVSPNVTVETERMGSGDISYILYTSGTTAKPKGAQTSVGGYAVGLYASLKLVFDVRDDDIFWCTADIGWVTGHSYIVYGPLMCGATTIIYEGSPDWPKIDRWWDIIERYGVTIWYTTPTAIRMLMKYPVDWIKKHDLGTLRVAHTVGEPINPEAFKWYYTHVSQEKTVSSSTWWMTETGHILTGHYPGMGVIYPLKAGTNGYPFPGVMLDVVDEEGESCPPGVRGYFVITSPFPSMLMTLYKDDERFLEVYYKKFRSKGWYFYSGDYAVKDPDGYIWVLGRADDVLKVSGHRIGAAEVESAMLLHPAVSESACVGKPDEVKGEIPAIFVALKQGFAATDELRDELKTHLRKTMGPVIASDATILFVDLVPKTRSGKIMRRLLKAVVTGRELGDVTTLEDEVAVVEARKAYEHLVSLLRKEEK